MSKRGWTASARGSQKIDSLNVRSIKGKGNYLVIAMLRVLSCMAILGAPMSRKYYVLRRVLHD